ncbi:hypothetical protein GLUCOINTEAF2_0202653 [Komagataeibacter intermedius AF2]|uniref:Uncharacterized protein n=1 Tax=Komagataeibacter intermedius AF2 TaxID=1458464 RepID=A0A0N0MEL0_9PROT|nr:hypothetical protein [Komagataeibacter intermedius]KPH86556.1 hypothetical protein GLUCOINTEAF2_0202653 [Komagataeibacter intermedius AF2]
MPATVALPLYAQHYEVVPPLPPEESLVLGEAAVRHKQTLSDLGEIAALAQLCQTIDQLDLWQANNVNIPVYICYLSIILQTEHNLI